MAYAQSIYARSVAKLLVLLLLGTSSGLAADRESRAIEDLATSRSEGKRVSAISILENVATEASARALGQALVDDSNARVRKEAASALWGHDQALAAEPQLRRALDDEAQIAVRAAGALKSAGIDPKELAKGFRKGLSSSKRGTAFSAARGLISIDPPETLLPALLAYLDWQHEKRNTKQVWAAGEALDRLVRAQPTPELYHGLKGYVDQDKPAAHYALNSSVSFDPAPAGHREWLMSKLASGNTELREAAVRALGEVKEPTATIAEGVSGVLSDGNLAVRQAAVRACQELAAVARVCVPDLIKLLAEDGDSDIRKSTAEALGDIAESQKDAPAAALGALAMAAQTDRDQWVRQSAVFAYADATASSAAPMTNLARIAAAQEKSFVASHALGRLLHKVEQPDGDVPQAVFDSVRPLASSDDANVASLASRVLAKEKR